MSDYLASWTLEEPCQCGERNYFTTSLTWEEVQMLDAVQEIAAAVGRLVVNRWTNGFYERLRIKDLTHEAVQVKYKCESCGHQFCRTYELKGVENGKQNRCGYYAQRRKEKLHSTKRLSFEYVEECFAQMWENYHLISRNCAHWAREFWAKVVGSGDAECCVM